MMVLLMLVMALTFYYLGLSFITTVEFKKKRIKLSLGLKLFLPYYILKTYIRVIRDNRHSKSIRKQAVVDLFFGFDFALIILVEIVAFGLENELLKSEKVEKVSLLSKISSFKNKNIRNPFANSIEEQMGYA